MDNVEHRFLCIFDEIKKLHSPSQKASESYDRIVGLLHDIESTKIVGDMKRFVLSYFSQMQQVQNMLKNGGFKFTHEQNTIQFLKNWTRYSPKLTLRKL